MFVDQTVFFNEDAHPARQGKFADIRADGVHGIGDENEAVFADEFAGDGEREGVNVHTVGDDAAVEAQFGGTTDNARLAAHQRRHGVVEVGHAAETFGESALHIGFRRHGVRGVDADAEIADAADGARRDAFRRQRDDAVLQVGGVFFVAGEVFVIGGADEARIVRAVFFRMDERPLEMPAEDAMHMAARFGDAGDAAQVVILRVADEGRQHGDGAIGAVRSEDVREAFCITVRIHQISAATICLRFDEAGAEDAAVQAAYGCINGQVAVGDDGDGFATVNEQAVLVQHDAIVKDTRALVIEGYGSSWWR